MKDIVISSKTVKREFFVVLASLCVAFCLNIYAVIHYGRPVVELVSMIGYVVITGAAIYLVSCVVRVAFFVVSTLMKKILRKGVR